MAKGKSLPPRKSNGRTRQTVKSEGKSAIGRKSGISVEDVAIQKTTATDTPVHSKQALVKKVSADGFEAIVDILKETQREGNSTVLLAQGLDPELQRKLSILVEKDPHVQITEAMHKLQCEMATVEKDLKRLTTETVWLNNEVVNILQALQTPLVMLDKNLVVRRYSAEVESLFGNSCFHVGQKVAAAISTYIPDLGTMVSRAMVDRSVQEAEVVGEEGEKMLLRVHPHVAANGRIEGTILTFVNVDAERRSEDLLRVHQMREQHVFDIVQSVLMVLDTYQNVRMISRSGCALLGLDGKDIIGKNWVDEFVPRNHRIVAREIFDRIMTGEVHDEYECPVATRGGEERILSWRSSVMRDNSGNVSGMICSGEDLTMLRQINNALENSEERFHVMMESVREDEFFILDTEGYIISWIARREPGKSYVAEEMVGQHFSRLYSPDDFQSGKPMRILDVAEKEGRFEEDGWRLRKDGKRARAYVIVIAIRDEEHNLIGFSNVTRYMHERPERGEQMSAPVTSFFMDSR